MRNRVSLRAAAVLVAALTAVTGCQPKASPANWSSPSAAPSVSLSPTQRLLGELKEISDLKSQIAETRQQMIVKCMEAKGFHVHPAPVEVAEKFTSPLPDPARWQLDPAKVAREGYGYGTTLVSPTPQETTPAPGAFDKLPQADQERYEAARDAQPKGCAAQIRLALIGPSAPPASFGAPSPADLLTVPVERAETDKRVVAMMKAWTKCMTGKGYAGLHSTDEAYKMTMRYYGAHGTTPVYSEATRHREIKQATADLSCRAKHKMTSVMVTVITEKATALLLEYKPWITFWRNEARQQLQRAQQYLKG